MGSGLLAWVLLLEDREGGFADGFCCMGRSNCNDLLDHCSFPSFFSFFVFLLHPSRLSWFDFANKATRWRKEEFLETYYGSRHREHLYLPGLISQTPQRLAFAFRTEGACVIATSPLSLPFCWFAAAFASDTCACWLLEIGFSFTELAAASMPDISAAALSSAGADEVELFSASPWRASDAIVCIDRRFAAGRLFNVWRVCDSIKV